MKYIDKPFNRLKKRNRAVFILHLAGYMNKELSLLLHISLRTIVRYIKAGYIQYPALGEGVDVALDKYNDEDV